MRLNKAEKESVLEGNLEVRRPVHRSRSGRALRCGVKIGDVAQANTRYFAARSVRRDSSEWVIGLEEVGEWAVPRSKQQKAATGDLEELLPEVLVWDEEPNLEVGDLIVFKWYETHIDSGTMMWAMKHEGRDGLAVPTETTRREPAEFLEITHVGRHKRGHWFARFTVRGTDKVEYLAPVTGTTTNPKRSIDADAPKLRVVDDPDVDRRSMDLRERNRMVQVKRRLLERLTKATNNTEKIRLTLAVADIDRKLEAAGEDVVKRAA